MKNRKTIVSLAADENRALSELRFTTDCKNDGKTYVYDFGGRDQYVELEEITGVFVWALYKRRNKMGHTSRDSQRHNLWKFLRFLLELGVRKPQELRRDTLVMYVDWLKQQPNLKFSTAGAHFRTLAPTFRQMSEHPSVSSDFLPPSNPFPKSSSLQTANEGYDQDELKSIMRAAITGMRETMTKFTKQYEPQWLGMPAPLDDVAPLSPAGGYSLWNSYDYKVWWWENNCNSSRLNSRQLAKIHQGQVFIASFRNDEQPGIAGVNKFYDELGAGEGYVPRYYKKPCPIQYRTPWKKPDYLVWYWENHLGCEQLSDAALKSASSEFYGAMKEYFNGRLRDFYRVLGLHAWISAVDLIPFYIMLLVRTQLNPSTIQRLTIDSLTPDPIDKSKQSIEWTKFRSSQSGKLISSDKAQDGWPVKLINKVIQVTSSIRGDGQLKLWIANSNRFKKSLPLGASGFKRAMQEFSKRHSLIDSSGKPLSIQAQLIRPTMAWQEYLRTEDIRYLQSILGHEKASTTAEYLRRISDPVLKFRRGIHIDAMFVNILSSETGSDDLTNAADLLLNSCSDPEKSPIDGQKEGVHCTAGHETCLSCPNLVITHQDIKKYFCYMRYHDQLLENGIIGEQDHRWATYEKKSVWEEQILVRYNPELIAAIRVEAELRPLAVWSQISEEAWS
ncbi:hypothetical protein [Pseudomonas japonica]|uniref:hypothetical protein n=1 Tax=Pseudomonas japonica TaxID=256466 RepID=UPI003A86A746